MKSRLAAGAAVLFLGVAGLTVAGPAEAGPGKLSIQPTNIAHEREMAAEAAALSLDPKCIMAFDTVMESCDGRDIGGDQDQASGQTDDGNGYASANQDDGDQADDGSYANDDSSDDGFDIV